MDVSSETLVLCYGSPSPGDLNSKDLSSEMLEVSSETLGFTPPGCPDKCRPGGCLAWGCVEEVSIEAL
eukprot:2572957-Pyramimonas_sp.AAC.1